MIADERTFVLLVARDGGNIRIRVSGRDFGFGGLTSILHTVHVYLDAWCWDAAQVRRRRGSIGVQGGSGGANTHGMESPAATTVAYPDHHIQPAEKHDTSTLLRHEDGKDRHPHIVFQRLPLSALSNTLRSYLSCRHAHCSECRPSTQGVISLWDWFSASHCFWFHTLFEPQDMQTGAF